MSFQSAELSGILPSICVVKSPGNVVQISYSGELQSQDLYIQQNRTAVPVLHLHTFAFITGCSSCKTKT